MELHIHLEDRGQIASQVYRQIRDAVLAGQLRPRDALPPSRKLAQRLGVSRTTVVVAYEQLHAEGLLSSRPGAGTYVNEKLRHRPRSVTRESPLLPRELWRELPELTDLTSPAEFDFRPGVPDAANFPFASWRARVNRQLSHRAVGTGACIGPGGHPALRDAIARKVGLSRGVHTCGNEVFVTHGSQQAIDLIARVMLETGDTVAVEDPGYRLARGIFHANGLRVAGVPVDDEGLRVECIPPRTRLVHVTPSHQYPLGMAMSMARRQELLAWAERADAAIIEDDYDSDFRYRGRPLASLHSLDPSGRVLYVGSFSRVLLPTLRVGFAVIPAPLQAAFRKAKQLGDYHTTVPLQAALAQFIEDGLLAGHIRRMQREYADRHYRVLNNLARYFDDLLEPIESHCGLHLAALFRGGSVAVDRMIAERARAEGVAVLPLSTQCVSAPQRNGLMFGYGAIRPERIDEGMRRMRRLVQSARA
jgi:GntR family transcriptional regulator / MocR family aminotransferase